MNILWGLQTCRELFNKPVCHVATFLLLFASLCYTCPKPISDRNLFMHTFRMAMAQINPTVGDLDGNARLILSFIDQARSLGVDLVAVPELALTGYPPEDLLLKHQFVQDSISIRDQIVSQTKNIAVVMGCVDLGEKLHNAAVVACEGKLEGIYHKIYLPNYGVFDEKRYFEPGMECPVYTINGVRIGVNICEDIWYEFGPT